ncbi:MAG: hypothetical protein LUC34_04050 [Campylobacter sp.]|nr:hypothetical protein [Campylobacter sp.]
MRITSYSEELNAQTLNFNKAFNRKIELANFGLGLGLYIANQIFTKRTHTLKDNIVEYIIRF